MAADYLAHPEANAEFEHAIVYYRERSYKVHLDFINEFEDRIDRLIANPLAGHPCYKTYRRINLNQFPYAIIYRPENGGIYVIAVIHEKQRPHYWVHRIEDAEA